MKYIFFADPGHSWLRVKKEEVEPIKDKISQCSYMRGKYVYLEEDCDACKFLLHKFGSIEGSKGHITEKHTNNSSVIRNYECYNSNLI